jgi:hypothetical protein
VKPLIIDGWTFEQHPRTLDLFTLKSETIAKCEDFWIYLSPIAHSPGLTRSVYFVDQLDKNAWVTRGQYRTKAEALEVYYSYRYAKHNGDTGGSSEK